VAQPGDVLISVRAPVGPTNVADVVCCIGRGLAAIRPHLDTDKEFILAALRFYEEDLAKLGSGSTFAAINRDVLTNLEIPLPPLPEQQRIAAQLTAQLAAVEQARTAAAAQLAAAAALPAAYLRAVFTSPAAQAWPRVPLGDLAILGPDNGIFKRRPDFGRGVPIVNVSDLYRSLAVDLNTVERVEVSSQELQRFGIAAGDLFFCRSSLKREGVGWCCYVQDVPEPAVFECHVMRVRLDPNKADPEYVAHYWMHPDVRQEVISNSRTATMTTMNQVDLAKVVIPTPPITEQRRIAAQLTAQMAAIEQLRTALAAQLATITALPATLLRRAFNGEL
jgi:type I restriction enzyme S subunit